MNRDSMIEAVRQRGTRPWDVIVIGGGATGLGAALDATSRGLEVLLVEARDFTQGTSSRSTKLIHGGVRYLRQGHLSLVRDSLRERGILMRNAPDLVRTLEFIVPGYRFWEPAYYGLGLKVYDVLAGKLSLGRSKVLSAATVIDRMPGLVAERLRGGTLYHDGQFDDSRLGVALARTAAARGGVLINYFPARGLLKSDGLKVCGIAAEDAETGEGYEIHARAVINATGPGADQIRCMDRPGESPMIRPSRGTHVVLEREFFPGTAALMIPNTDDGRVLFLIPWHGRLLLGTTDVSCSSDESTASVPDESEIDYLLEHAARYLARKPRREDVRSVFSGVRPLVREPVAGARSATATSEVSRDHVIEVSEGGLVTIAGGKWTTYRKMAADVVDRAIRAGSLSAGESRTTDLPLEVGQIEPFSQEGGAQNPGCGDADIDRAISEEMARTVEDVLARRSRLLLLDARESLTVAPAVAGRLALALGHDSCWRENQLLRYREQVVAHLPAGEGPESPSTP